MRIHGLLSCLLFVLSCSAGSAEQRASRGGGGQNTGQGGVGGLDLGSGGTNVSVGGLGTGGGATGCPTSVSGVVYDPAGRLPLYNVVVYVPSEPLAPISEGAACETCDGNFSGRPIAAAVTDAAGRFKIDNVPAGDAVPLVIQVGKWRREISVSVAACADTPITDAELTRLPRSQAEGNLPKIAVVRGGSDALECLIRKLGVEDAEFTPDSGTGRVHLYHSSAGTATDGTSTMASGAALTDADTLYADLSKMMTYDMLLIGCEGADDSFDGYSVEQFQAVRAYADQGGRIFGSHYNNRWIYWQEYTEDTPYPSVVEFLSGAHNFGEGATVTLTVDTSFPKGQAFADWLFNVGASSAPGQIDVRDSEHTVAAVVHPNARQWISLPSDSRGHTNVPQYFSFPAPVDGPECGRMVFSELHVSAGSGDSGKEPFPNGCTHPELSAQEKALAFMLFDLSSCVQPEDDPIVPPVIF